MSSFFGLLGLSWVVVVPYVLSSVNFTPALGRKPEEVVTSDLVAGGFPTDMGEGGVNLAIPLVAAIEYVYLNERTFVDAYQLVAGFQFDVFYKTR